METAQKQSNTIFSGVGSMTGGTVDDQGNRIPEFHSEQPLNLNQTGFVDANLLSRIVESSSSEPCIHTTEPEIWRYSAGNGRDFLPKPKAWSFHDDVSAPISSGEPSSTKLQRLERDDSPPPPPPLPPQSPGFDGEFDENGEISYAEDDFFSPRGRRSSENQPERKVTVARSIGNDSDDDPAGGFFPSRQGSTSSRKVSISRSVGNDPEVDGELFLPSLSWKVANVMKYIKRERSRTRPRLGLGTILRMRSCEALFAGPPKGQTLPIVIDNYKYESLDPSANQIRLIRLEPKCSSGITASLFIASLNDAPKYEALSYTWGNSHLHSSIQVDNSPFHVTQNLGTALENLMGSEVRVLWIDAICINQKDDKERSDQVSKMRTIYAQASAVVVWLGNHSQHSTLAVSLLQEMDAKLNDKWHMKRLLGSTKNLNALQGLSKVLNREYWWRIWVIQEVHFAPQITIHCGDSSISWAKLIRIQEQLSTKYSQAIHDLSALHSSLRHLYTAVKFRGPTSLIVNRSSLSNPKTSLVPTLFEALLMHRLKHSTDPRDKIYALVGLTTARSDPNFQIDYSHSVRQVYIDTASYILTTSKTLDFLCAKTKGDEFPQDLPSWCPNWASTGANCPIPFRHATRIGTYAASQNLPPRASINKTTGTLTTKGLHIRSLTHISPPSPMKTINDTQGAIQTVHIFFQFLNSLNLQNPSPTTHPHLPHHLQFLTLLLGPTPLHDDHELEPLLQHLSEYQDLIDYWVIPPPLPADLTHLSQVFEQTFFKRRLFVTERGEMGLCEEGGSVGDGVCILFGCFLPVLLRWVGGEAGDEVGRDGSNRIDGINNTEEKVLESKKCHFISDVLLGGFMHGRAIKEFESGRGGYSEETFVLGG
ncbi:hypothetical protein HYALB_00009191 [Hymenoscyphus albidus]|uniref:Heterokaryon incompatibility domain-containing protein n=1 Tax=Hymenoscyphus albidus TaxID=595503 RepID=A0A9N9LQG2_9HELO|nr:hypothetical protein HYALB_00009191 [Hymenoscyphus albidus]